MNKLMVARGYFVVEIDVKACNVQYFRYTRCDVKEVPPVADVCALITASPVGGE